MSSQKHLWSGDWERDSAARAEELATHARLQIEQPPQEAAPATAPAATGTRLITRVAHVVGAVLAGLLALLRALGRGVISVFKGLTARTAVLVAGVALIVVAVAFGLGALFGGGSSSGGSQTGSLRAADALLGVQLSVPPGGGVVIATLEQGGPAELAGLDPGDVVTAVDNEPIDNSGNVAAAFKGLHAGGQAVVQVSRGSTIISTLVTLASHP